MFRESNPSSAGETSRPQGKLQCQRIVTVTAEEGVCESCKRSTLFSFTIEGFPNSKLCRPCGIYYKKNPTTFISQDVWTEPRIYGGWKYFLFVMFFFWTLLNLVIIFRHLQVFLICPILYFFAFIFGLLTCHINHYRVEPPAGTLHKKVENLVTRVEGTFGCLVRWLNLTETDYLEDTVDVIQQRIHIKLAAGDEELAKIRDELDDLRKEIANLRSTSQEEISFCDDSDGDGIPQWEHDSTDSDNLDESDYVLVDGQ